MKITDSYIWIPTHIGKTADQKLFCRLLFAFAIGTVEKLWIIQFFQFGEFG